MWSYIQITRAIPRFAPNLALACFDLTHKEAVSRFELMVDFYIDCTHRNNRFRSNLKPDLSSAPFSSTRIDVQLDFQIFGSTTFWIFIHQLFLIKFILWNFHFLIFSLFVEWQQMNNQQNTFQRVLLQTRTNHWNCIKIQNTLLIITFVTTYTYRIV